MRISECQKKKVLELHNPILQLLLHKKGLLIIPRYKKNRYDHIKNPQSINHCL